MTPEDLSPAVRAWAERALGARVVGCEPLTGGVSSTIFRIDLDGGAPVVVRQYEEPGEAERIMCHEAEALEALERSEVPAPRLIDVDPTGDATGDRAALLMTCVPGRIHLQPADAEKWVAELAGVLPKIHAAPVKTRAYRRQYADDLAPPEWSQHPELWHRVIDLVADGFPPYDPVFIHRDFHQFNVLFEGDRLSGVVDWHSCSMGVPDIDVGHGRLALAAVFSPDLAATFLTTYESIAGRRVDPYWDCVALLRYLPGWGSFIQFQAGRALAVDLAGMHARADEHLVAAVARLDA